MKLFNSIENIAPFLRGVEDAVLASAAELRSRIQGLHRAGEAPLAIARVVDRDRTDLLARLRSIFPDTELEAADALCNRANGSDLLANTDRVGLGHDRFRLLVPHVGAPVTYAQDHRKASAHVFAHYNLNTGQSLVLIVDGNHGASVTNYAGELIAFIQREHVGRRGIKWRNTRWVYRDSSGAWDEIVVTAFGGGTQADVGFAPLGDRSSDAVQAAAAAIGIRFDSHDWAHIRLAIPPRRST